MDKKKLEKLAKEFAKQKKEKAQPKSKEELIKEAQVLDKKRSKARKTPTKEEKAQIELQAMLDYKPEQSKPIVEDVPVYDDTKWDVPKDQPIEFFDPELSYELTGYRPITATRGLDFDPKLFTVAADTYRKTGRYTQLAPGTFRHRSHWVEEFNRCRDGITIGKYTLTGENYFFLNYFRLPSVLDKTGVETQEENFPAFLAKQYEYFHYLELCRKSGHDGMAFKSRGVGASQIAASNCACAYTFHKGSRNMVTAFSDNYVDDTLSKVWQELDFLNTQTEGAFKRVRMKIDTSRKKKASKVDQNRNETGWGSIIEGVVADEPRKLRGARVYNLFFEEAGSNPQLISTYIQARALVVINGYRVGSRYCFGTAGDKGPNLAGLKDMFYNPEDYLMLPYRHHYTRTSEVILTGYFIPSYTMWFGTPDNPGFDSRGVVDEKRARAYYESTWAKITDPRKILQDKAEYCFTPEDAFVLEGGNVFDQAKLAEQQMNIETLKLVEPPKKARLLWPYSKELGGVDKNQTPTIEFRDDGNIQIAELPMRDASGLPIQNLYVIGVDGVDLGKETSTGQKDVSKYAIVVLRRAIGLKPPKIVACYKERPDNPEDAHNTALKLAQFYNGKILFEATRVSIFAHFKHLGKLNYFLKRPRTVITSRAQNANQYGCPAVGSIIDHQIELIQQYVFDYSDQIDFIEIIDELTRYSIEAKRKFDYVAALGMALLADEDMMGRTPRENSDSVHKVQNIGYYKNEYGQKVFGIIDNKRKPGGIETVNYGWVRDPNPRLN